MGTNIILQKILYYFKCGAQILSILLIVCACNKKSLKNNSLKISFNTAPTTTDPRKCADFVSSTLVCMIYEGLTRCLPGGAVENALAEKITISEDGKTYLFHLRRAYWSNGKPITAFDFERSWKKILSPAGPCAFLFYPIKNAEKCVNKEASIDDVGIHAVNDRLLKVELTHPTPYFRSLTAFPCFLPAPSGNEPDLSILSGPFLVEKYAPSSEIVLKKNPLFWNEKQIHLDEIHISIIPDEMTALQMFERNELDWLGGPLSPLPPDALERLKSQLIFIPNAASTICTFNTEKGPFDNENLRKAFSFAIDREEIVNQITQSGQIPARSILPPVFSQISYSFSDEAKAKAYFAKALDELQISPKELESLTLYFKPSQIDKRVAQTLQRQWQKAFGITISLNMLDYKSHAQRLQNRDYQISLGTWIAQFDDPVSILDRFKEKTSLKNYPGWENGLYKEMLDSAKNGKNREDLLVKAELILIEHLPLCPIYHWSSPAICSERVAKIATTPQGGILFERFELLAN